MSDKVSNREDMYTVYKLPADVSLRPDYPFAPSPPTYSLFTAVSPPISYKSKNKKDDTSKNNYEKSIYRSGRGRNATIN